MMKFNEMMRATVDNALDSIFTTRRMLPTDEKASLDEYVKTKGSELMEKLETMNDGEFVIHTLKEITKKMDKRGAMDEK